ncbi:MAG: diguanylate cyclase domain-containing protein, partial [Actinomycetota bacterium]
DLKKAINELEKLNKEKEAIIQGINAVLKFKSFEKTAQFIFTTCKNIIGATSGYVALLSKNGKENEVLYLDSGGLPCTVDSDLPMPIRGLRKKAYEETRVVYDNNFNASHWTKYLPKGHAKLNNVLFAPLILDGKAVGLLGLANKKEGFDREDKKIALTFGNIAAAALYNNRTYEKLKESETRFRTLINTAGSFIIVLTTEYKIIEYNKSSAKFFGYNKEEVMGRNFLELSVPTKERNGLENSLQEVLNGTDIKNYEQEIKTKDGGSYITLWNITKISSLEDIDTGILMVGQDITERKQIEKKLEFLSYHDELTGLYNRAFFEKEIERLDTERQLPLSILMMDLNNLKYVNDKLGHLEGDKLLKKFGEILKNCCRSEDIIARWGGDEFTVLLPKTSKFLARKIIRRIEKKLDLERSKGVPLSVGIGLSVKQTMDKNINTTIKEAEKVMYEDKNAKKDRLNNLIR